MARKGDKGRLRAKRGKREKEGEKAKKLGAKAPPAKRNEEI